VSKVSVIYTALYQKISNALSTSRQYFAKKYIFNGRLNMLRLLSAGSRRLSGIVNSRLKGPRQHNTDDQNCSGDNAERSTSTRAD